MPVAARVLVVIPARLASSRLPRKPLIDIEGLPLVVRVAFRARGMATPHALVVATADDEVAETAHRHGLAVALTSDAHPTGTDRVAEVARSGDWDLVLNVQGDEPLLESKALDALVECALRPGVDSATLAAPYPEGVSLDDPSHVKVVWDASGRAELFSRRPPEGRTPALHLGVYAFRPPILQRYVSWPQGALERLERLEQLRLLENGVSMHVVPWPRAWRSVNTPEDLDRIRLEMSTLGEET